jgi:hypothetical protein
LSGRFFQKIQSSPPWSDRALPYRGRNGNPRLPVDQPSHLECRAALILTFAQQVQPKPSRSIDRRG